MGRQSKYTIPAMLRNTYGVYGEQLSLVYAGDGNRTYKQLEVEVNQVAKLLCLLSIEKGDKVVILSTNMPNWGIAYFAIATIGAEKCHDLIRRHCNLCSCLCQRRLNKYNSTTPTTTAA